jgi:peroxiredoxin
MLRHRLVPTAIVAIAGVVAVVATLAVLDDDAPAVDGEFVLDEPGIFQQPLDDVNADTSGERLPDVVLSDASGAAVTLDEYRGAPLVVNFWFSRCAPCRRELRDFATVHSELGDTIQFVGVDPFDTVDAMLAFAQERGVTYDLLRDTGEHSGDRLLTDELGLVGYPVTLFVDADGRIVRQTGEIDADELRAAIEELF